ncbi:TonB-dependent receptor [Niabella digestorum]|uniref:TonB-dependent receptor n=1 Tax=Niabella digestorum TaxID=3117701 RepID=A0ABU7RJR1_9BACT
MRILGLISSLLFFVTICQAQTIKGTLMDPVEGVVVRNATVKLLNPLDSNTIKSTLSDTSGTFIFNNIEKGNYLLHATSVGFEPLFMSLALTDEKPALDLDDVYIPKKTTTLEGVVVVASAPAVSQKGDTTQFSASHFKVNPDATVEDLIKKMPGITVDRSGNVTAQGEQVRKVTVDGKEFFGDDATMALRNLPAEVIDKIQVFDRLSDQAQLTGFDDGNSMRAINIVTKGGVSNNGQFGRIYAGYGTDQRYQAGGNVSFFNGDRRISLVGNFNNVNQQNFATQDLLGVTSSGRGGGFGGGRGGGGFGGGFGGFGSAGNFMVGVQPGINKTNAFGINYGDKWGKKIDVSASYFFNNSNTLNESSTFGQTTISPDSVLYTGNKYISNANNNNHRFNMRLEYKIDSNNTIFIIPSLNFQNNNSASENSSYSYYDQTDSINNAAGRNSSHRNGYNINNNIMYRRAFAKRGRTLAVSLQTSWNKNDGYSYNYNQLRYYQPVLTDSLLDQYRYNNTNGSRISGRISYTEPVGKEGQFEFQVERQVQKNNADQRTYDFDGTAYTIFQPEFSNEFDNTISTNRGELNYRLGRSRDNQISVGVEFQNSKLESDRIFPTATSVNQEFNAILPNMRLMKKVGANSNIRIFYRARTDFPSISQLQDVVTISSSNLNVSTGNPALKQSYTHFGSFRYSYTNRRTNNSFFANIFGQITNNYITTATYIPRADSVIQDGIVVKRGSQFSKPINLNGYKQISSYFVYSFPISALKSNINLNAGVNYTDRPGLINYLETKTTTTAINGGAVWSSNISEYIDFNLSYNANFNNTKSTANNTNNRYVNQQGGVFVNLLSKNGWFIQNDVNYQSYTGLSQGLNQSFWLWNAAVGKKFLKNNAAELKLSVFDLLKQNQSISRTINANYIEDAQSRVLQQYFMLTFTYSLRNFGKGRSSSNNTMGDRSDWRQGPPPGMMPGGMRHGPMF